MSKLLPELLWRCKNGHAFSSSAAEDEMTCPMPVIRNEVPDFLGLLAPYTSTVRERQKAVTGRIAKCDEEIQAVKCPEHHKQLVRIEGEQTIFDRFECPNCDYGALLSRG